MIELKTKDLAFEGTFYFHTMQDCNDFLYVFKDHWCNVPWEKPREVPNDFPIGESQRKSMDKPPKERAENNLSWGFSLVKYLNIDLSESQNLFVKGTVAKGCDCEIRKSPNGVAVIKVKKEVVSK